MPRKYLEIRGNEIASETILGQNDTASWRPDDRVLHA